MSHFHKKVIFGFGHWDEKLGLTDSDLSSGKVSPRLNKSLIYDFTWLATGSRMDSMVFVWKTGIFLAFYLIRMNKRKSLCALTLLLSSANFWIIFFCTVKRKLFSITNFISFWILIIKSKIIKKLWTHCAKQVWNVSDPLSNWNEKPNFIGIFFLSHRSMCWSWREVHARETLWREFGEKFIRKVNKVVSE